MTSWVFFIGCFIGIILGVILSYRTAVLPLHHRISTLAYQDEQYHEKMKYYPYDLSRFRFIGTPVHGIQFEDDAILFVRLKEGAVPFTKEQEHIKNLLKDGKVEWFEFTVS